MDLGDDTRGQFNVIKVKAKFENMIQTARILIAVFGLIGIGIALGNAEHIGRLAAYNAGLLLVGLAGCMVIAAGALQGHLTIVRVVEAKCEEIDAKLDVRGAAFAAEMDEILRLEKRHGEVIGELLEDELRCRRNGHSH